MSIFPGFPYAMFGLGMVAYCVFGEALDLSFGFDAPQWFKVAIFIGGLFLAAYGISSVLGQFPGIAK